MVLFLPFCLLSSLPAQEVLFDTDALSDFGKRQYKMVWIDRSSGSPVEHDRGTMSLWADVTEEGISIHNVTRMFLPDGVRFIEYEWACQCSSDETLSIRQIKGKVTRSDGVLLNSTQIKVEDGELVHSYTSDGKSAKSRSKWIEGTVVDLALFFLVPQLSHDKGQSIIVDSVLNSPMNRLEDPSSCQLDCLGIDNDMSSDGSILTKFESRKKGEKEVMTFWVDESGMAQIILLNSENRLDLIREQLQLDKPGIRH